MVMAIDGEKQMLFVIRYFGFHVMTEGAARRFPWPMLVVGFMGWMGLLVVAGMAGDNIFFGRGSGGDVALIVCALIVAHLFLALCFNAAIALRDRSDNK
jgi:hypothetical protein